MSESETYMDASASPDGDLVKGVYAHFGLCMYLSQVFETGMINILTVLQMQAGHGRGRSDFDNLYAKNEALTFGNLRQALVAFKFLPDDLITEISQLKGERDRLAHRFFRDHDLDFITIGGCHRMIEVLMRLQEKFQNLDEKVSVFQSLAYERLGLTSEAFEENTKKILNQMRSEARARFSSAIPSSKII